MYFLCMSIYAAALLLGLCNALPIPTTKAGEFNTMAIGLLGFIGIGALLGACVCCRRRKRGFEEFTNEPSRTEVGHSEFPIFRALSSSADQSNERSSVNNSPAIIVSNNQHNVSRDRLLDQDFDNNNGPISPVDMENIENNNAVDYIPNRNEIGVVVEPSNYAINRNLVASGITPENVTQPILSMPSSSASFAPNQSHIEVSHSSANNETIMAIISSKPITTNSSIDYDYLEVNTICQLKDNNVTTEDDIVLNIETIPNPIIVSDVYSLKQECKMVTNPFLIGNVFTESNEPCELNLTENNEITTLTEKVTGKEDGNASIASETSEKSSSPDINSVEEALRALDFAIGDEDNTYDQDNEDNINDENPDSTNFQHVLTQFLIDNVTNSLHLSQHSEDCIKMLSNDHPDESTNIKLKIDMDEVKSEASILVDSVLSRCEQIIEIIKSKSSDSCGPSSEITVLKKDRDSDDEETCLLDESFVTAKIGNKINSDNKSSSEQIQDFKMPQINACSSNIECIKAIPLDTSSDSLEELFFTNVPNSKLLQSTPSVVKKCETKIYKEPILSQKSLFNENSPTENKPSSDEFNLEKTDKLLDKTYPLDSPRDYNMPANGTFVIDEMSPKNNDECQKNDATFIQIEHQSPNTEQILISNNDCPAIILEKDKEETTSEDLTTVTPVNTPIEINYSLDSWDKFITTSMNQNIPNKKIDPVFDINQPSTSSQTIFLSSSTSSSSSGWFLHPQTNKENETFDIDDNEEENMDLTFDALRKQLAQVLPHAQGIAGPPDYSDEEDSSNQNERQSNSYGITYGDLDEATNALTNEVVINYKRTLSPIMEESEEETYKTFVLNETKCLDSTSTGCVETGEAIMGVTKTLMASNDTLFNFEDTLGDRDDIFSPCASSQADLNTIVLNFDCNKLSSEMNNVELLLSETFVANNQNSSEKTNEENDSSAQKKNVKSLDLVGGKTEPVTDLCSPDQQKTFSEDINTVEHGSSDLSGNLDQDATFTTNTIEGETCISVAGNFNNTFVDDDERISEISEPDWNSSISYNNKNIANDCNSLCDVPDLIIESCEIGGKYICPTDDSLNVVESNINHIAVNENGDDNMLDSISDSDVRNEDNTTIIVDNSELNGTENCTEDKEKCSEKDSETESCLDETVILGKYSNQNPEHEGSEDSGHNHHNHYSTMEFLNKEVEYNSDQHYHNSARPIQNVFISNTKQMPCERNNCSTITNGTVNKIFQEIKEKELNKLWSDMTIHCESTLISFNKHPSLISNYNIYEMENQNEDSGGIVVSEGQCLSGEEDPWVSTVPQTMADIRFTGPASEMLTTSFNTNEWDSEEEEESNSSEEFMYMKGKISPSAETEDDKNHEFIHKQSNEMKSLDDESNVEQNIWASHQDQVPVTTHQLNNKDDTKESAPINSEDSSSDIEGEFIPSCWDSMALPARSAMKSPDKSSSSKKRRSVVFKKQRYHSVYEYPREVVPLSPAYSEPQIWDKNFTGIRSSSAEYNADCNELDGFLVSSSTRPFHSSQFHAQCNTWPTDADFSWSQIQDNIDENVKYPDFNDIPIEWPRTLGEYLHEDGTKQDEEIDVTDFPPRPDSGVGESAELLSEPISFGDLCHTKGFLRLPLTTVNVTNIGENNYNSSNNTLENNLVTDNFLLPTPSCTGSMDSLSSSSGSDRPISFTTFGKSQINFDENNSKDNINSECNELKTAIVMIENDVESNVNNINHHNEDDDDVDDIIVTDDTVNELDLNDCSPNKTNHDRSTRISDSTDEDSGIENISRFIK